MCNCVQSGVDNLVDFVWPEIMEEIKYELKVAV